MGQGGHGLHFPAEPPGVLLVWHAVIAGQVTALLSVQILYAKQGLRVRRGLTRANVKEKVKETRRILAKLRFMAQEVRLLPGQPISGHKRAWARRGSWAALLSSG